MLLAILQNNYLLSEIVLIKLNIGILWAMEPPSQKICQIYKSINISRKTDSNQAE